MTVDYTTTALFKESQNIASTNTDDDDFIGKLITRSSRAIDKMTRRQIVAESAVRKFHAVDDVDGDILYLDEDLALITTVTNGDSTVIASSNYVLLPTNYSPKYAIRLTKSSSVSWTYDTQPEDAIEITGDWGYSTGTPDDIIHAANMLTTFFYKKRDVPFLEVGLSDQNLGPVLVSIPNDIRAILSPYEKLVLAGSPGG